MRILIFWFQVFAFGLCAQVANPCKQTFDNYLNFNGTLNSMLVFSGEKIKVHLPGEKSPFVFQNSQETALMAAVLKQAPPGHALAILRAKGQNTMKQSLADSLERLYPDEERDFMVDTFSLGGIRIAIDPGHFATTLKEAAAEQKHLHFATASGDSVKLFESQLTYNTALLLKKMLEKRGADVYLTRGAENQTSFGLSYSEWMIKHRRRTLDSLKKAGELTPAKHARLVKCNAHDFFWEFFRDHDLIHRVKLINDFKPDLTIIIHYNVDEKNAPWQKTSDKNFTMTFIGGAFTPKDLQKDISKTDFLRLLLGKQLLISEKLSGLTVKEFSSGLGIKVAGPNDATYLKNNCKPTASPGVYCRNLLLCRRVNSPLVYGEALYQDNEKECMELMKEDLDFENIGTNARLLQVARCYFAAILKYYGKK